MPQFAHLMTARRGDMSISFSAPHLTRS